MEIEKTIGNEKMPSELKNPFSKTQRRTMGNKQRQKRRRNFEPCKVTQNRNNHKNNLTMKKIIKSLKLWVVYKITYYEITYGIFRCAYGCYSKQERKSIAYNIANEYLNF